MNKKIISKLENKEFVQKLLSFHSDNEVKELFDHFGIEISDKELDELAEIISEIMKSMKNMTESELEEIAGGGKIIFSDYFREAGKRQGIDQGGSPAKGFKMFDYGVFDNRFFKSLGMHYEPGTPDVKGTAMGNFLYNNSNELALVSIAGAAAVLTLGATYLFEKGEQWFQNRGK